ncbi:MAG: tRNA-dihydrouridine synthase [Kiritimatiellaeota bacterium]|nr:tRNA-dihydrouridine synthase [Kiritimatiellota bacterium]
MTPPRPLQLRTLTIAPPVALAPMAGFTNSAFRAICRRYHCGWVLTELVSSEGLARRDPKTLHYLEATPAERPVAAHLYGHDPDVMARAAAVAEALGRFDLIDINAGCPVPKIMSRGAGAGLLRDPERLKAMVQAVRAMVRLPVTVKTRLGISPQRVNISEVAQAVEEGGADALVVHARVASRRHAGPADWAWLARLARERRLPIIGNGGIGTAQDAVAMLRQTGVAGVMIGRAAIGNPWIFDETACLLSGRPYAPPPAAERCAVLLEHLRRLVELLEGERRFRRRMRLTPEQAACLQFRAHLVRAFHGRPGLRELIRRFDALTTLAAVEGAVTEMFAGLDAAGGSC